MAQNKAKSQNVSEFPITPITERKNWLTRKAAAQLTAVRTATARPQMRLGKISLITVQSTGPSGNANERMNATKPIRVASPGALWTARLLATEAAAAPDGAMK